MAVYLSPLAGSAQQFFDNNGVPLAGGKIHTYSAGTTTPLASYTDNTGATPHSNPIILNSAGRVSSGEIWLSKGTPYKFAVYTSLDVLIGTYDNISGINDPTGVTPAIYNATANGIDTTFTMASAPTNENTTSIFINGVYQQKNTYSFAGATVTFSEAPPYNASIEIAYF